MSDIRKKRRFYADLKAMGFASYDKYLASPLWSHIKCMTFAKRGRICKRCNNQTATEIHHSSYSIDVLRGEKISALFPVCHDCHEAMHYRGATLRDANMELPQFQLEAQAKARKRKGRRDRGRAAKLERIKRLGCNPRAFGMGGGE